MKDYKSCLKVMSVDDEQEVTCVISDYLLTEGFDVKSYNDPYTALRTLTDNDWRPDVILVDIMMPSMDGYQFCQHLQAEPELREIPVMFLTAKDRNDDSCAFLKSGGQLFIKKPFKLTDLKQLLLLAAQVGYDF